MNSTATDSSVSDSPASAPPAPGAQFFSPSQTWAACREFGQDTVLRLEADLESPEPERAAEGLQDFLSGLHRNATGETTESGSFSWGGYTVETAAVAGGLLPRITLSSAGEDGLDSILDAADSLAAAVAEADPAAEITWTEIPHTRG